MNTGRGSARAALHLVGAALVTFWLFAAPRPVDVWTWIGVLAVLAWLGGALLRGTERAAAALAGVALAAASVAVIPTGGITFTPVVVAVLLLWADDAVPAWAAIAGSIAAPALMAVGSIGQAPGVPTLLAFGGGIVIASLAGASRRQTRRLLRQEATLRQQQQEAAEQAARAALARDLHDVLAHTLGGLVLQLDATEALIERGETDAALVRSRSARRLAGEGLDEARRAVAALRSGAERDGHERPGEVMDAVEELLRTHRSLGGSATFETDGTPWETSDAQAAALVRAAQEALSNARRHAPGHPVDVRIRWSTDRVLLAVANDVATASGASPGGFGLRGMRERVDALPRGGRVDIGQDGSRFQVRMEVRR
ncbi:sensor histidine kinase [Microbacterium sp. RG1]|uniref:sensor histidine kinase n=1 Tax=Microbacterium sp. RG1 TaxID=2489212 RepID=UPI0010CA4021|nr:histidine kinase [Microbacterium sp. RG1]QCQ15713.1 two-component sensor histidine kinase [Microbacterium sp. RG1]